MLAGQMSNQDEDEVEDELEELERQAGVGAKLPDVPTSALPEEGERDQATRASQRARERAKARAQKAVPMEA